MHVRATNEPLPGAAEPDTNVLIGTRLLSRRVTEICDRRLRPFGVSAHQFSLLEVIGRTEPATRATIARTQQLDKSTLTRNLRSIFSQGWVVEVREEANGRSKPIALTESGRKLLHDAGPAWLTAQGEAKDWLGRQGTIAVLDHVDHNTHAETSTDSPTPQKPNSQTK